MKVDMQDIYENIGNVFYAVAKAQGMKPIQAGELKLIISNNWLPRYNEADDYFPTPAAHTILVTLDALLAVDATAKDAYTRFMQFYLLHTEVFTHELRIHISETIAEIVRIFSNSTIPNPIEGSVNELFRPVSA